MGFFALAALVVAVVPLVFGLSPAQEAALDGIQGSPWPASLTHVTFGVGTGKALAVYVLAAKGWLR